MEFPDLFGTQKVNHPRRPRGMAKPRNAIDVPKGLVFLADTNEFAGDHQGYPLEPRIERKLLVGDYSVLTPGGLSLEAEVVVERKSLVNILGDTVSESRERFERCLARLAEVRYRALVIEADWKDLRGSFEHTKVNPTAVRGSLIAWSIRYGVAVWMAGDRREGMELTKRILIRGFVEHQRGTEHVEEQGDP